MNETSHERFRRSPNATTLSECPAEPGPGLLRKFNSSTKQDDLVEDVDLAEAKPSYACICNKDSRENGGIKRLGVCVRRMFLHVRVRREKMSPVRFPRQRLRYRLKTVAPPDPVDIPLVTSVSRVSPALYPVDKKHAGKTPDCYGLVNYF